MNPTASSLERAAICPPSHSLPQVRRPSSEYADRGNAAHRFVELVNTGTSIEDALLQIPTEHQLLCQSIDPDLLAHGLASEVALAFDVVTGNGWEIGRSLSRSYGDLPSSTIAGTADIVGVSPEGVLVEDLKTGFSPVAPAASNYQLRFLALAAARAYGRDTAIVRIVRMREDGSIWRDSATLDALDLDAFAIELRDVLARVRGAEAWQLALHHVPDVVTGDHCRWCGAWDACPAQAAAITRLAFGAEFDEIEMLKPMSPATAGLAWSRLSAVRSLTRRLEAACMGAINEYGELPLPSGKILRKVTGPGKRRIDGRIAYGVVREALGQDVAEDAVEIRASQAALDRALMRAAEAKVIPARGRSKVAKQIMETIEERGGITRPITTTIEEVDLALPAASDETEGV